MATFTRNALLALLVPSFFGSAPALNAAAAGWPEIHRTPPADRKYTLTLHYRYEQRLYEDATSGRTFVANEPAFNGSAEAVLQSQLSAMRQGKFDWWLKTWDDEAAARYAADDKPGSVERKRLLDNGMKSLSAARSIRLVRWILTGGYVIVTYRLEGSRDTRETALAFKMTNGLWKATLSLEQDPVFLHCMDDVNSFERVVR